MQLIPKPPIVVDESGDVEVYATVEDACADLEVADLNRGAFGLFDSEGRELHARVSGYDVLGMRVVSAETHKEELAARLRHFILEAGAERVGLVEVETASLEQLLAALIEFQRDFPKGRGRLSGGCCRSRSIQMGGKRLRKSIE